MSVTDYASTCVEPTIVNEETRKALEQIERKEDLHYAKDADDLFEQLGI